MRKSVETGVKSTVPPIVFREDWTTKQERVRSQSAYGSHPNWRLLPILIKSNDDLRQEQLVAQVINCISNVLAKANILIWLYPYDIIALTHRAGIIEAIPDTISIDSLRKNYPNFTDLKSFYVELYDRHNGNILLTHRGHLIYIDFGFFYLSSSGKKSGFESAPFKLTHDFVGLMDGPKSRTFKKFRELCYKTILELRKNYDVTLIIEMLLEGNEDLDCFQG